MAGITPFKRLTPGGQISAAEMNRLMQQVERLAAIRSTSDGNTTVNFIGGQPLIDHKTKRYFPIKITAAATSGKYQWSEVGDNGSGTLAVLSEGMSGTTSVHPAYAVDGNTAVAVNSIVLAWFGADGNSVLFLPPMSGTGEVRSAVDCEVISATANAVGWYPGKIVTYSTSSQTFTRTSDAWITGLNSLTLTTGYYQGLLWDQSTAIAVDAASNSGYQAAASSYNWNHTWYGSNRFIAVSVSILSDTRTVSSITYNGVALSLIKAQSNGVRRVECWGKSATGLSDLAAGTYAVAVTLSGSCNSSAAAVSYTGVDQTTPTESENSSSGTNSGSATDASLTITPTTNSCWIHAAIVTDDTAITAGQTSRNNVTGASGSGANEDNNAAVNPAAATAMTYTAMSTTAAWAMAGFAIRPGATPVVLVTDPLQVQDDDANPNYATRKLQFDQDDGFSISNPTAGTSKIDLLTQMSVTANSSGIKLDGDASSPGNLQLYGTNGSGTRGWYDQGITVAEQDGSPSYTVTTTLQFEESDGFVVSQPSANTVLVRLTGTFTQDLYFTNVYNSGDYYWNSIKIIEYVTLSSSQNNYSVAVSVTFLIINATANISITGIAIAGGNTDAHVLIIVNVGTGTITLVHGSGSSAAENTFSFPMAADITLAANGDNVAITYNSMSAQWHAMYSGFVPTSAAPTLSGNGDIAIDSSVTDWSHGVLQYYGGETMGVVAMPIAQYTSPTGGYVVAYNSTNDEFELVAQSGVSDGDKGDITVSVGGTTWTIDNNVVSDAKLRDSGACSVIGRTANSLGDPADISAASNGLYLMRRSNTVLFAAPSADDITSGTLLVAYGGTGRTSHTAYGVICGGTTSTAAQQSVAVGGSGQVLTSNGAGALPSFQSLPAASDSASGIQENAVQSEQETGTSTTLTVTPGRQHFHPGHPKAWCRWDMDSGGSPAITTSYKGSSITDNGTGDQTVNWSVTFSSATAYGVNYTLGVTTSRPSCSVHTLGTTSTRVEAVNEGTAALADFSYAFLSCFGDL